MDDLTPAERRLVLGALWNYRDVLGKSFDRASEIDDVEFDEIDAIDRLDSAAVKLGGDPHRTLYGAADY